MIQEDHAGDIASPRSWDKEYAEAVPALLTGQLVPDRWAECAAA